MMFTLLPGHLADWLLGGKLKDFHPTHNISLGYANVSYRAVAVNAQVQQGQNILITGIGGGVALLAMQICLAKGVNVYVTSGHPEKIQKAISLGATGGANYKNSQLNNFLGSFARIN